MLAQVIWLVGYVTHLLVVHRHQMFGLSATDTVDTRIAHSRHGHPCGLVVIGQFITMQPQPDKCVLQNIGGIVIVTHNTLCHT